MVLGGVVALLAASTEGWAGRARVGAEGARGRSTPHEQLLQTAATAVLLAPAAAFGAFQEIDVGTGLGYIDDAGVKSYSQVQRAWEKSATLTEREKYLQARGVLLDRPEGAAPESARSQKRRAMAGCHDTQFRQAAGLSTEADCNARVLGGDVQFMLDVMDGG